MRIFHTCLRFLLRPLPKEEQEEEEDKEGGKKKKKKEEQEEEKDEGEGGGFGVINWFSFLQNGINHINPPPGHQWAYWDNVGDILTRKKGT